MAILHGAYAISADFTDTQHHVALHAAHMFGAWYQITAVRTSHYHSRSCRSPPRHRDEAHTTVCPSATRHARTLLLPPRRRPPPPPPPPAAAVTVRPASEDSLPAKPPGPQASRWEHARRVTPFRLLKMLNVPGLQQEQVRAPSERSRKRRERRERRRVGVGSRTFERSAFLVAKWTQAERGVEVCSPSQLCAGYGRRARSRTRPHTYSERTAPGVEQTNHYLWADGDGPDAILWSKTAPKKRNACARRRKGAGAP